MADVDQKLVGGARMSDIMDSCGYQRRQDLQVGKDILEGS